MQVPSISVRINDDWHSWKGWVFDKTQAPHGPMLFEMTHFTDVCNWFLADQPLEVTAVATGMLNESVIVRYQSGALAHYCARKQRYLRLLQRTLRISWATAVIWRSITCWKFVPRA